VQAIQTPRWHVSEYDFLVTGEYALTESGSASPACRTAIATLEANSQDVVVFRARSSEHITAPAGGDDVGVPVVDVA
jgi:hypothetical protein